MSTPFITAQSLGTLRNNNTGTTGFILQVGPSDLTVDALGRWVVSGNSGSHDVTIYDIAGASVVATATINTSGATAGDYKYVSITPVTLTAGKRYAIESAETNGGDQWYDDDTTVTQDPTAGTVESAVFSHTSAHNGYNNSYGPVNFKFTVVTSIEIACRFAKDLGNSGGGSSSFTASYTVGSGSNRLLVVAVAGDSSTDKITGVTFNGTSMTLANKVQGGRWLYLFYLLNPDSGTHNVVVSASSADFILAAAADYIGVAQSGQPDNTTTAHKGATGSDTLTATLTTVVDNCFTILASQGFSSGAAPLAGTGSLRRIFGVAFGYPGIFDSNAPKNPAGSTSMEWHWATSNHEMASVMASFAPFNPAVDHPYTGSAGARLGGASVVTHTQAFTAKGSGGARLGGSATLARTIFYPYTGSGGARLGGAAIVQPVLIVGAARGSGGAQFMGAALTRKLELFSTHGSGGLRMFGAAITGAAVPFLQRGKTAVRIRGQSAAVTRVR